MRASKLLAGRVGRTVSASPWISSFFMGRAFFVVSLAAIRGEALGLHVVHIPATGAFHL